MPIAQTKAAEVEKRRLPEPLTEEQRKAKYLKPSKMIWYPHLQDKGNT
jgi:hypothetical protein